MSSPRQRNLRIFLEDTAYVFSKLSGNLFCLSAWPWHELPAPARIADNLVLAGSYDPFGFLRRTALKLVQKIINSVQIPKRLHIKRVQVLIVPVWGVSLFPVYQQMAVAAKNTVIDHIAVSAAAETVKPLVYLHAGRMVIMENTADHPRMIHGNAIALSRVSGCHGVFYSVK